MPLAIVGSDSNGYLHLVDAATSAMACSWKAHDYEAWISAFDHEGSVVFSGMTCVHEVKVLQAGAAHTNRWG